MLCYAKSLQSSPTVWPHRRQPTRLPCPRDSPGKNTGVGCHFLLQCMKVRSESEVAQLYPTLSDPMDCSLPGSSVQGIFQAGVLEWGAIAFFYHLTFFMYQWRLSVSSKLSFSLQKAAVTITIKVLPNSEGEVGVSGSTLSALEAVFHAYNLKA